jgi:hypothetical protein
MWFRLSQVSARNRVGVPGIERNKVQGFQVLKGIGLGFPGIERNRVRVSRY